MAARQAVTAPHDVMISRGANGRAVIRHRLGADLIGEMYHDGDGWHSVDAQGRELPSGARNHQRTAMMDLIGVYNTGAATPLRRASSPMLPAAQRPEQTPLMAQLGIPAATLLATPVTGAAAGPRMTTSAASGAAGGSSAGSSAGLTPKGMAIYKKLKDRGFPAPRALAFARRAQSFGGKKK